MRTIDPVRRSIIDHRLAAQRFTGNMAADAAGVVSGFAAMQGQEYLMARWSIGQRSAGVTEADVDAALADGTVIRTHVLRDTWHIAARDDIRWLMDLTGPRVHQRNGTMQRRLGLDDATLRRGAGIMAEALRGGARLTRPELADALAAGGITASGMALTYHVMYAELEQVVCSGGLRGKQHTYALFDEVVPAAPTLPPDEALAELVVRYVAGHGPATVKDVATWSSMKLTDIRRGVELAGERLRPTEYEGRTYLAPAGAAPEPGPGAPRAELVQLLDEYLIGFSESRDLVSPPEMAALFRTDGDRHFHVVLLDGVAVGLWRRDLVGRGVTVDTVFTRDLRRGEQRQVDDAIERYVAHASQAPGDA